MADWATLPPAGAGGRDEVEVRLWLLGSEILVWTTAPLLFRDELVVADAAWALLARPIRVR